MFLRADWQTLLIFSFALLLSLVFLKRLLWWLLGFDKKFARLLSQAKSADVRYGKLNETLAPLVESFPVDIKKPGTTTIFLGQPIDYIHFDPEAGITFIEVKSGTSKLSPSQRKLKDAIAQGRVSWVEVRLK